MGRPLAGGAGRWWLAIVRGVLIAVVLVAGPNAARADEEEGGTVPVHVRSAPSTEIEGAGEPRATDAPSEVPGVTTTPDGETVYEVAARETPTPMPEPQIAEPPPPPPVGEQIVAFALQYQGYPYVWAGNTAAGFDCSGFTQFVILNVLGIDIGHGLGGQTGAGAWVDWEAWQPGDLVFFQNTYQGGLSHVGIYIGDGLFIHAENEGTGVVISSMYSDYYGSRYYGAVRVA